MLPPDAGLPPAGFERAPWGEALGEATALLQQLLRIDTTNPPGNELSAARALAVALGADGLRCEVLESAPGRANLVCRLSASREGAEPPLLLAAHLDVVPAGAPEKWTHPPFAGVLADGMLWGRGAVDMKNMVAMCAMVMKLLARRETPLRRDIIFAAVADEEEGCRHGSQFLVEQHPELVRAGFAIGEIGGFPLRAGKALLVPVQTAEKGVAWLRLLARGPAGHGSMPRSDSAPLRLARALTRLADWLPQHNTPVVVSFVRELAAMQPLPDRWVLPRILDPRLGPLILDRLLPDKAQARQFHTLLRNTATPTVLRSGSKTNVLPDEAYAEIDGRLLPGQTAHDLIAELRARLRDDELRLEVLRESLAVVNDPPDSELWDCIRSGIQRYSGLPAVPYMIPGLTDASQFSRLGTRWYGFSPLWLDPDSGLRFADLFHGYDERIPEDGFHWGLGLLYAVVRAFCT